MIEVIKIEFIVPANLQQLLHLNLLSPSSSSSSSSSSLSLSTVVTVGLQPLTSNPRERDTFFVCAEITSGSLERNVVVGLEAENNTAIRKLYIVHKGRTRAKTGKLKYIAKF